MPSAFELRVGAAVAPAAVGSGVAVTSTSRASSRRLASRLALPGGLGIPSSSRSLRSGAPTRPLHQRQAATVVRGALKDWRSSSSGGESNPFGGLDPYARRRLEQAWTIQQQPVPVACESCCAEGMKECEWCSGSGYFVLGDKMLCEVPSRNTHCVICHGEGTVRCADCLGTGFRARWLETLMEKKK